MDPGSTTMALTARLRKRSISSQHSSSADPETRVIMKTKIQKIDGQYQVSPTCPRTTQQQQQQQRNKMDHSHDDHDEPMIVGTVPPLIQDSSKYRIRQDVYDDETGDDQLSNASSTDYSPVHQSQSPSKPSLVINQSFNDHENETPNEASLHIPTTPTNSSHDLIHDDVQAVQSIQLPAKTIKKTSTTKPALSSSTSAISSEPTQTPDETLAKDQSSTAADVPLSNNKQSQSLPDPSKVKVRLKPIPPSPQAKKDNKTIVNPKPIKAAEQKPLKKPVATQKEPPVALKKSTLPVTPKKPVKPPVVKPAVEAKNSEKQPIRTPATTPAKPVEKKTSDTANSLTPTTMKKPTETPPPKPAPVVLGKIPKLNPAAKVKATLSKSLTDQRVDLLPASGDSPGNPEPTAIPDKNPPPRPTPLITSSNLPALISPMDLIDSTENSTRFSSSSDNSSRLPSNPPRMNSMASENPQSQSPLSPAPSSTLYPPPSPPTLQPLTLPPTLQPFILPPVLPPLTLPPTRPLLRPNKPYVDARTNQSTLPPPLLPTLPVNGSAQSLTRKPFPIRQSASANQINTSQLIPPLLSSLTNYKGAITKKKSNSFWDSASSEEELEDDTRARLFFNQNMRAVDEELSKIDDKTKTPLVPADARTEELLKRQKKASLCLSSNGGSYQEATMEPAASADDFECVEMDLDSPNHRTQSESSDHTCTAVESNNSKTTSNGPAETVATGQTTASSTETSKQVPGKVRPLKTTSMTLIDELKNSINPSSSSKQASLSPLSRSLSRSRSRTRSRSRSRSRSHSRTRSRSRSRSRSRLRSRSRSRSVSSYSTSSSSSSRKRSGRGRRRPSKRHSTKHYQRRRSNSYDDNNKHMGHENNNYPPPPPPSMHYQSHHQHHQHQHWQQGRQPPNLLSGPPPQPPLPYSHQPPVPPLLPPHPYYPPSNRAMMPPVEPNNGGGRYPFQHNSHPRHHPPLMNSTYYPQGQPQPLMQTASHAHHYPLNRYPPPARPFDMPPHLMGGMSNAGPYAANSNYNQFRYESDEHQAMRRAKAGGGHANANHRGGLQQSEFNGKQRVNDRSNTRYPDLSASGAPKPPATQDEEGEEGEISESD